MATEVAGSEWRGRRASMTLTPVVPVALGRAQSAGPGPAVRPLPSVVVGGIPLFDGTREEAERACLDAIRSGRGGRIATANLDFFAQARQNPRLCHDLQSSTLVVADGMPIVALARLAGAASIERTAGVDLVASLCRAGGRDDEFRVVLYGAEPRVAQVARRVIEQLGDGVQVTLVLSPPFRPLHPRERAAEQEEIRQARPHLVLVALGCPRQEERIREYYPAVPEALWIGVGGTLDLLAGRRRRAHRWMQRAGLEWCVRMIQEPARLGPRYFRRDLPALLPLLAEAWSARRQSTRAHLPDGAPPPFNEGSRGLPERGPYGPQNVTRAGVALGLAPPGRPGLAATATKRAEPGTLDGASER